MKHISLIVAFFLAVLFSACGAKEETTEQTDPNAEVIDETQDTSMAYSDNAEFIDEGEDFDPTDSTENMTPPETNEDMVLVDEQDDAAQPEEIKVEETVKEEVVEQPKVHETKYYIVVGSFKKFANAQNLSNYFEKEGYKPMIIDKDVTGGYFRVAISSYVEKANAKKAVKRVREKYNDQTFWIYKW